MRKHVLKNRQAGLFIALIAVSFATTAQQLPRTVPAPYPVGVKVSYVRSWTASVPETDPNNLILATRSLREVKQATQYFDGLGRPLQTVAKQGAYPTGGSAVDLISMNEYDAFGREPFKYLPTAANGTGANTSISDGNFKFNPFAQQAVFYADNTINAANNSLSGIINNQGEKFYYGKTNFEASPLNRPTSNYAPGDNWAGTDGGTNRGTKISYFLNTPTDNVRIWNVTVGPLGSFSTYSSPAAYGTGLLYKTITSDENGNQVIEFKDKEGKVILKKVQLITTPGVADDGSGRGHDNFLCTYYLYDDLNNLRCVIQPKGVEFIKATWVLTDATIPGATILAEQCFRYEYDQRNRMIIKKVPGAAEVYMVYDGRDRMVMTQDGNLRTTTQWIVTLYDELNRPFQTGKFTTATVFTSLLPAAYSMGATLLTAYPFANNVTPVGLTWEYLTKTGYDNYDNIPAPSSLTKTYDPLYNAHLTAGTATPDFADAPITAGTINTKGMVTWTETKVLNTSTYTYGVILYDEKGRTVQVKTKNLTSGFDVATTQYTWAGQPIITVQKQEKAGAPVQTSVVVSKLTYDDLGRPLKTEKRLQNTLVNGNVMSAYTTVSTNEYNALGQLARKSLGSKKDPATGAYYVTRQQLAKQEYQYNIRGWMLAINKQYITNTVNNDQYFGMQLGYDKNGDLGTFAPQFNGNISGTIWKGEGDQQKRKYDFTYDAVNRLLKADFNQYVSGSGPTATLNKSALIDFSMQMGDGIDATKAYDANGNILAMKQWGLQLMSSSVIDDLKYSYITNTNKLKSVTDFSNSATTKLGDFKTNTTHPQSGTKATLNGGSTPAQFDAITDYSYDANGNLLRDYNKDIITFSGTDGIQYNHLNLPVQVTFKKDALTNKGTITYTYDASGTKLKKVTVENPSAANLNKTITTTTNYIGGFVYESKTTVPANTPNDNYADVLQFMPQEEGRIRFVKTNAKLEFDYFLKDHLGNTRMVLTDEVQIDKYPVASLEPAKINTEKAYYKIVDANVVPAPSGIPAPMYSNDNGIGNNPTDAVFSAAASTKMYDLKATSAGSPKTGLDITLKVMAGDRIDIFGKSFWQYPLGTTSIASSPFNMVALDILNAFTATDGVIGTGKGLTGTTLNSYNSVPMTTGTNGFLNNQPAQTTSMPRAFINYIFFDENFNYVSGGFSVVGGSGSVKDHIADLQNKTATKNGYVYIYCSNESQIDVYFDNLQVRHTRSALIEETHYYPFGLTMAGISSKAAGITPNKRKFNAGSELQSEEFSDGSGLELYSTQFRSLDPQLGRWWQIDPKPNYCQSLYSAMDNNPILKNDPLGDVAGIEGFTQKEILKRLNQGLNVNKKGSPFSFDKKGNLQIDDAKYNKLSDAQKKVAFNIREQIKSDKTFILKKMDGDAILPGYTNKTLNNTFAGAATVGYTDNKRETVATSPEESKVVVSYMTDAKEFTPGYKRDATSGEVIPNPDWLVTFHEWGGGHAYYRYIAKDPEQAGHTIDHENRVRALNTGMGQASYDPAHQEPTKE